MGNNQINQISQINRINPIKTVVFLCIFVSFGLFWACNTKQVYYEQESIPRAVWSKNNRIQFSYTVPDTSTLYSLEVDIENTNEYMYSNVFLFSTITFPDSLTVRDTLECIIADYQGEWTGKGLWNYTNTFGFKQKIRFPIPGTYTFSFEQAMRCANKECELVGITNVGLRINKL